jgi:hypothetical protein
VTWLAVGEVQKIKCHVAPASRDSSGDHLIRWNVTNTAVSAARLYWENTLAFFAPKGVAIPVAVSVFLDEIYAAPRSWAARAYPKLTITTDLTKAGTSRPGNSPNSLQQRCARISDNCVHSGAVEVVWFG